MNQLIKILPKKDLFISLAASLEETIQELQKKQTKISIVLSGGNSPKELLKELAKKNIEWSSIHFFWSDERYVSHTNEDNNYFLANELLFKEITIPTENIHPIPTDNQDPFVSAQRYEQELKTFFNNETDFDIVLLGLGEDGHTASLFPGFSELKEEKLLVVPVFNSPKPPSIRITLTYPTLNSNKDTIFLTTGKEKAHAVYEVLKGAKDKNECPAKGITSKNSISWWVDEAAGSLL